MLKLLLQKTVKNFLSSFFPISFIYYNKILDHVEELSPNFEVTLLFLIIRFLNKFYLILCIDRNGSFTGPYHLSSVGCVWSMP